MSISQERRETVLWYSIKNRKQLTLEEILVGQALDFILRPISINVISQEIFYNFQLEKFYITDFLILPFGIIVEVDGNQHNSSQIEYDSERDNFLKNLGLLILRFDNEIVRNNLREVIITIFKAIGNRIDYKLSNRFWEWHQSCKKKEKEILNKFSYQDWQKVKELNKRLKNKKNFLKQKIQFNKDYIYQISKEIQKQMFLNIK